MRNPALDAWGDYDRDDPYPLFAQVRADGPVHEVTLADGHRAWLIAGHEEAKAALNHAGLSKDMHAALARDGAVVAEGLPGPAFARHMLSVDPPDHTRLRRLTSAAFSRPRIAALRPRIQAITGRLLDGLEARGDTVVDLVKGFAFPLPFTVISELLGVPESDRDQLGTRFTTLLAPSSAPEPPAEAVAASANVVEYLTELLARKRAAPGQDLVTDLVRAADQDGALSEQEMLSTIFQLVVAGHDTTTSLIGNGTAALLLHPEQRDAIVDDPALVPHAIEEILRWDAPVPHSTFRYTTQDVALGRTVIPAFAQVIISLAAANRDPDRYDHPETLDITRADTSHLAFGHGIHHCLGARLARLEGTIALTTLHGRSPAMRPCRVVSAIVPSSRASRAPRQWWMPWPKARWLVSARVMSKVCGLGCRAGSRLAAASEMITWAKAGMTVLPRATSWVVYRNVECGTGASHRRISSIACGTRAGSSTIASRCSGCSSRAAVPLPIRLVVVSCPATTSWKMVESISCLDSAPS